MKTITFNSYSLVLKISMDITKGDLFIQFNDIGTKPMIMSVWEYDSSPPPECVIYKVLELKIKDI
jgi:hypothetical protein